MRTKQGGVEFPMQDFSRVDRSLSAAASYYTALAPWYDMLAASEKKYIRVGLTLLDPQPGEFILEIGFGTGYAQLPIANAVAGGFSVGVDLSPGMARIAQGKLTKGGLNNQAGLVCSDSLPLPFPRDRFDGVFSSFTLELFDSPLIPKLLEECRRVLKPSGRLVAVSLSRDRPLPWPARLYDALHNRYPRTLDCRPIPLKSLLEGNGYRILKEQNKNMWGLPVILVKADIHSDNQSS